MFFAQCLNIVPFRHRMHAVYVVRTVRRTLGLPSTWQGGPIKKHFLLLYTFMV